MKRICSLLFVIGMSLSYLVAQPSLYSMVHTKPTSKIPNIAFFKTGNEVKVENFENWLLKTYHLSEGLSFKLINAFQDDQGMIHYRYSQIYKGLDIEATMLIVHTRNGLVTGFNGLAFDYFNLLVKPTLSREKAMDDAAKWFGAEAQPKEFGSQLPGKVTGDSSWKGILIIAPLNGKFEQPYYRLSWRFELFSNDGPRGEHIYVDANNSGVIFNLPLIHSADSSCTAKTAYRGIRSITTFYNSDSNRFESHQRSRFIDMQNSTKYDSTYYRYINFYKNTNNWTFNNSDSFINDCYWGTEQTDKLYKNWFGRNGYNGNGSQYLAYVGNYLGAFSFGSVAMFSKTFTSLDIVGHEFTHAVTGCNSKLVYTHEPGALNESLSDIFGKTVEWYADSASGKFSWSIGNDLTSGGFRNMKDPSLRFYKGKNWFTGSADNGGVHYNSSVLNYFYYLITAGDSGINEAGYKYTVDSLGFYTASHILYRLQTVYLTSTSDYQDAANCLILAVADLHGNCSIEMKAVSEALKAIGLHPVTLVPPGKSTVTQLTTATAIGRQKVCILKLHIKGNCNTALNDSLQGIYLNMTGTTNLGSVSNLRVYYTVDTNKFDTSTLIYQQAIIQKNIYINKNLLLNKIASNFWILVDVKSTAKHMDLIDISVDSLRMNRVWQVPNNNNPEGNVIILACKPNGTYSTICGFMPIVSMVKFANATLLDSSCSAYDSAYRIIDPVFFVTPGQNYKLTLRAYYKDYYSADTSFAHIWIDFNRNGTFESTELVLHGKLPNPNIGTTVSIPATQSYGRMLMRITSSTDSAYGNKPCGLIYGSVCDIIINVGKRINSIVPALGCLGKPIWYTAIADSNVNYSWYLNNESQPIFTGKGSKGNILTYIPQTAGLYSITLRTYTTNPSNYSVHSVTKQVALDSMPVPIYNPSVIKLCQGQQTILKTDSIYVSPSSNLLQISYDASKGQSGLKSAKKVYIHSALTDKPGGSWKYIQGNWGKDDGVGLMTKVGNKWNISFNPLDYYMPEQLIELKYIAIIFRNEDGSQIGTDSIGNYIYLRIDSIIPVSSSNSVVATYRKNINWLKDGKVLQGKTGSSLQVSTSGSYQVQITGTSCNYLSNPIQVIVDTFPVAGYITPFASKICASSSQMLYLNNHKGTQLDWQIADSSGAGWTSTGITSDSILISPTKASWYKVVIKGGACASVITDSVRVDIDSAAIGGKIISNKNKLCFGESVVLNLQGSVGNIAWQQKTNSGWNYISGSFDTLSVTPATDALYRAELSSGTCPKVYADSMLLTIEKPQLDSIKLSPKTICEGDSAYLEVFLYKATNYQWYKESQVISGANLSSLWVNDSSRYTVQITDSFGCNVTSSPIKLKVNATPLPIDFILKGHQLYIDSNLYKGMAINWYIDGAIQSTQNFSIYADSNHTYSALIYTTDGCSRLSSEYKVNYTGITNTLSQTINIYPNPSSGIYYIVSDQAESMNFVLTDIAGRQITINFNSQKEIDLSNEAAGIYILHISVGGQTQSYRLIRY